MELYSWSPGCYGLASWDRETLSIQTYCAFAGVPLNLKHTNNPFWTPGGKFPLFKHKDTVRLTDFEAIVSYLSRYFGYICLFKQSRVFSQLIDDPFPSPLCRCCGFNLDYNLGSKEKSDSVALNKLLEEKLLPALVYSLYANAVNFDVVLRPMLAERLRFPLSFFYIPR